MTAQMHRPRVHLDYARISASLLAVRDALPQLDAEQGTRRDRLDGHVVSNMVAGYAMVERLVNTRIDLLGHGGASHLLELNRMVLCGADAARRHEYRLHLEASERRFYEERHAGVDDVYEHAAMLAGRSPWDRAAGVYVRILSKPQLFIEGNQRTGALVAAWILLDAGEAPFVLTVASAPEYFAPAGAIRDIRKSSMAGVIRLPSYRRRFARLLRANADRAFLIDTSRRGPAHDTTAAPPRPTTTGATT